MALVERTHPAPTTSWAQLAGATSTLVLRSDVGRGAPVRRFQASSLHCPRRCDREPRASDTPSRPQGGRRRPTPQYYNTDVIRCKISEGRACGPDRGLSSSVTGHGNPHLGKVMPSAPCLQETAGQANQRANRCENNDYEAPKYRRSKCVSSGGAASDVRLIGSPANAARVSLTSGANAPTRVGQLWGAGRVWLSSSEKSPGTSAEIASRRGARGTRSRSARSTKIPCAIDNYGQSRFATVSQKLGSSCIYLQRCR
jgi:hypothetical protein